MKVDYSPFSVALVDLFASAMMCFMVLTFIALPKITFTDNMTKEHPIAKLVLPIIFDGNQWYLREEHYGILDLVGRDLQRSTRRIQLVGHTANSGPSTRNCLILDEFGDAGSDRDIKQIQTTESKKKCFKKGEWNTYLSEQRAKSVRKYLINNYNIHPDRIAAVGMGKKEPIQGIPKYDARNRRVELHYTD